MAAVVGILLGFFLGGSWRVSAKEQSTHRNNSLQAVDLFFAVLTETLSYRTLFSFF
jgi:hypothetical protein